MNTEDERLFNDFATFNKWQIMNGTKVNNGVTEPSIYITEVKLKKAFSNISKEGIENLFDKELNEVSLKVHREKLNKKLAMIAKEHLFLALKIFIETDDLDGCAEYVLNCKSHREPDENY